MTQSSHQLRGQWLINEPMSRHVSWKAGGRARRAYLPADLSDLCDALSWLHHIDPAESLLMVGLGSNLLVRDGGFPGTVIFTYPALNKIHLESHLLFAESGVALAKIARRASREGLAGAHFLASIPGTLGGALMMNAGCFGHETWPLVHKVLTINRKGELHTRSAADFDVGYRHVVAKNSREEWFAAAWLNLPQDNESVARDPANNITSLLQRRNESQPLKWPNAGSVFTNPPTMHAARLIEQAGLKGTSRGGAVVSEKHANFILNPEGTATASDIEDLIIEVQRRVHEHSGVELHTEVKIVGVRA